MAVMRKSKTREVTFLICEPCIQFISHQLMTDFIHHFQQYIEVSESLETELADRIERRVFKKGELVHNSNQVCNETFFIQKGLLRLYFVRNGKEVSEYFCSEGEWVNSPRSFMFGKLSKSKSTIRKRINRNQRKINRSQSTISGS